MRRAYVMVILLLLGCETPRQLDIQGHRGYRGLFPENTLLGFKKALELGVNTLELDVVISKDSLVVVSHEPFMNHEIALDAFGREIEKQNETSFNLFQMAYDSIKQYDCGSRVHMRFPGQEKEKTYKPLLKEVIDMAEDISNKSVYYNIEIKSKPEIDRLFTPHLDAYVDLVVNVIVSKGVEKRTIIQSFDLRALELTKLRYPKLQLALLVDETESIEGKLSDLSFKPNIVSPYFKLLNAEIVKRLHSKGFKVIPWTVNEPSDIAQIIALNVDGIISDYPNRVIELNH